MLNPLRLGRALALLIAVSFVPAYGQDTVTEEIIAKPEAAIVRLETNYGDITIKMLPEKAPITVANFLQYVDDGFYDDTIFHRVIRNFMIQGGGFTEALVQKETRETIVNESRNRLHNVRGSVAMARQNDPDTASAQFFINQRSNLRLDWAPGKPGYTVFAEVTDGMPVVDFIATAETQNAIATTPRGASPMSDVPVEPVILKRAYRVTE